MRVLKFIVEGQLIKPDPACDFSGLVPGTNGYLMAKFSFSSEWDGCRKVASFWSPMGREYAPQILTSDNSCTIPCDALKHYFFRIGIIGKKDDFKLTTNKVVVIQDGGKI